MDGLSMSGGRGGCSRRQVLQGVGGALAAFWTRWAAADNEQRPVAPKVKAVTLIFNCGAPSHIDLWDPKPEAADTVRGPYQPLATTRPTAGPRP